MENEEGLCATHKEFSEKKEGKSREYTKTERGQVETVENKKQLK